MPGNTAPIFSKAASISGGRGITAANTAKDGTGTVTTVFTADATNGSYLQKLRFRALGTNVATVCRIFLNNGGANTTATNNLLFDEITLAATTLSEVASTSGYDLPMNMALPAGWTVFVTLGTAVAAGWTVTGVGGNY